MKLTCPKCGRVLGDTQKSIDAHINCKRCGEQEIHARVASFDNYLKATEATEESND